MISANPSDIHPPIGGLNSVELSSEAPASDSPISYSLNDSGSYEPISFFGDDAWLMHPYVNTAERKYNLYFNKLKFDDRHSPEYRDECINMLKWLTFLSIKSVETIKPSYLHGKLNIYYQWMNYCISENIKFSAFVSSLEHWGRIFSTLSEGVVIKSLTAVRTLAKQGRSKTGLSFVAPETLQTTFDITHASSDQILIIPSRILKLFLFDSFTILNEFEENKAAIFAWMKLRRTTKQFGQPCAKDPSLTFSHTISEHKLDELVSKYRINNGPEMESYIRRVIVVSKFLIHSLTGMRDAEVRSLSYGCLEEFEPNIYRVWGETTKQEENGPARTYWITTADIKTPISVLESVVEHFSDLWNEDPKHFPLFFTYRFGPSSKLNSDLRADVTQAAKLTHTALNRTTKKQTVFQPWLSYSITEQDIVELEEYEQVQDRPRDFRNEARFEIGQPWHFTSHQFRRSLAVYLLGSGKVSLSSLCRQYQHLNRDMTLYYAKSYQFTQDTFGDYELHFAHEIQKSLIPEAVTSVLKGIVDAKGLVGSGAKKILSELGPQLSSLGGEDHRNIIQGMRKDLTEKAEAGQIAYKATPLGACLSAGPCRTRMQATGLSACIKCKDAMIKIPALNEEIVRQTSLVQNIETEAPLSLDLKFERENLDELVHFRNRMV